jgi:hypothetical protein
VVLSNELEGKVALSLSIALYATATAFDLGFPLSLPAYWLDRHLFHSSSLPVDR